MITKEQIINILEEHSFKVYQHGDVVAKSDFDNIADCIVKNLNIPAVIKSVCDVKKWGETCTLTPSDKCCNQCSHYVKQTVL